MCRTLQHLFDRRHTHTWRQPRAHELVSRSVTRSDKPLATGVVRQAALPSGAQFERMRVMVNTFCSGQSLTTHDRKRRHDDLTLESDARPLTQTTQQSSDSLLTPFGQHGPHSKRQRLNVSSCNMVVVRGFLFACPVTAENGWTLVEDHTSLNHIFLQCQEAQLTQMQSTSTLPDRHSFSGQGCYVVSSSHAEYKHADCVVSCLESYNLFLACLQTTAKLAGSLHPGLPQPELHWTASDGYSTSNSVSQQTVMMEDDQQSNTPLHQQHQPTPQRTHGMSHSSSAPDLRLMLATQIPDSKPLSLPALGSYAGVMVPYKGPEVRRCSTAHDTAHDTA